MTSAYFHWLKLFGSVAKRIESVDAAKCPRCGARQLNVQYVASPRERIGYGTMWCENCWHGIWISRTNVPEGWSYATFEEAEGIIPNFVRIEPEEQAPRSEPRP